MDASDYDLGVYLFHGTEEEEKSTIFLNNSQSGSQFIRSTSEKKVYVNY